jgi:hypothetical protein
LAIFLLGIYSFTSTPLAELIKAPFLLAHYQEHKAYNHQLLFLDFINLHYSDSVHSEQETDTNLPFKSITSLLNGQISIVQPFFSLTKIVVLKFDAPEVSFWDYTFTYFATYLSAIWQPPKF